MPVTIAGTVQGAAQAFQAAMASQRWLILTLFATPVVDLAFDRFMGRVDGPEAPRNVLVPLPAD